MSAIYAGTTLEGVWGSEKRTERETVNLLLIAPPWNQNPNVVTVIWCTAVLEIVYVGL